MPPSSQDASGLGSTAVRSEAYESASLVGGTSFSGVEERDMVELDNKHKSHCVPGPEYQDRRDTSLTTPSTCDANTGGTRPPSDASAASTDSTSSSSPSSSPSSSSTTPHTHSASCVSGTEEIPQGADVDATSSPTTTTPHSRPPKTSRPSWIRRVLTSTHLSRSSECKSTTRRSPEPKCPISPPHDTAHPAQQPAQPPTTTNIYPDRARAPSATRAPPSTHSESRTYTDVTAESRQRQARLNTQRTFAPISLMPVVGYDYTMENTCWKAPPVRGPSVRRKKLRSKNNGQGDDLYRPALGPTCQNVRSTAGEARGLKSVSTAALQSLRDCI